MAIGRTDEWRQSSQGQRHINAVELFGCHSRNPSGLAVMGPRQQAGHMTAFVQPPNSCNVALESRAVPHTTRVENMSRDAWDGQASGDVPFWFWFGFAVLEAEAVIAGLDDVAMMGESVEERGSHFGVAKSPRLFAEAEVDGDDDAGALIELGEQLEEQRVA